MFSIAYIDKPRDNNSSRKSFHSQSLRVIVIGRSTTSNCVEFYHPPSKQVLTSADYRIDPTLAAGPTFNMNYDGGLFFNTYHNEADTHIMSTHALDTTVYVKLNHNSNIHVAAKVIGISQKESDLYTLQDLQTRSICDIPEHRIIAYNPHALPDNIIKN